MNRLIIAILVGVVLFIGIGVAVLVAEGPASGESADAPVTKSMDPAGAETPAPLALGERVAMPPRVPGLEQADPLIREAIESAHQRVEASDEAWAWHDLAEVCHGNGHLETAAVCYEQALIRDQSRAKSAYLLALIEQRRGNTARALELIAHVEAMDDFAPAHWRAGQWLLDAGDVDGAVSQFERALAIDSDSDAASFGIVRVHLMRGESEAAIDVLERDLAETSNAAYRDQLLASAYRRAGQPERAAAISAGAARGLPVWRDPWLQEVDDQKTGYVGEMERASRLIDGGRHAEAVELLGRVREHFPRREALMINLALAESNLGGRDRAEQVLRETLEFAPESHLAWQNLGAILVTKAIASDSAPDEAFACLDRAIEINPRDTRARMLKGDFHATRREIDEAITWYRRALEIDGRYVQAYDKIGVIYAQQRRFDEALAEFERIVAIDPKADPIWVRIASLNVVLGRPEPAQRALNEAARRIPRTNPQLRQIQQRIDQLVAGDG